jgi:hypothetical protein
VPPEEDVHVRRVSGSTGWLGRFATIAVIYAAAVVALAAECRVFTLEVPDTDTMKFEDGEHVVASARTDKGLLEAKVLVRARRAAAAQYYIGGKLMRPTPDERVPAEIQECLGIKKAALSSPIDWLSTAGRTVHDFLEPPLAAFTCKTTCSCSQTTCCCLAKCGAGRGVGCASI